jgi:hypothetical protein
MSIVPGRDEQEILERLERIEAKLDQFIRLQSEAAKSVSKPPAGFERPLPSEPFLKG